MKRFRILSVDWDYFFPTEDNIALFDWGHKESLFFTEGIIWNIRAAAFYRNNLPLPGLSEDVKTFWQQFRFGKGAKLYIAESHVEIYKLAQNVAEIHNFDAHHDAGYSRALEEIMKSGRIDCGEWAAALPQARIVTHYPRWHESSERQPKVSNVELLIDDGQALSQEFHLVFVCRSGAWVPPWLDADFEKFLKACPVKQRTGYLELRHFDETEAKVVLGAENFAIMSWETGKMPQNG